MFGDVVPHYLGRAGSDLAESPPFAHLSSNAAGKSVIGVL
jgi:hypothetical protein